MRKPQISAVNSDVPITLGGQAVGGGWGTRDGGRC
jgi:hypothetical protein